MYIEAEKDFCSNSQSENKKKALGPEKGRVASLMDRRQREELIRLAGHGLRFDCPMSELTTFRVGGPAEAIYEAADGDRLAVVVRYLNQEGIPYLPVGRGSNLLVNDEGLDGVVILLRGPLACVNQGPVSLDCTESQALKTGAGLFLSDLVAYCCKTGLCGLEFLAGIPGTVGGAVVMNAGAFGYEMGPRVLAIHAITPLGERVEVGRELLRFHYRGMLALEPLEGLGGDANPSIPGPPVITHVGLGLEQGPPDEIGQRVSMVLKARKEKQPLEYPSAGSVFKNPPQDPAGRLIERVGLKGRRIGGAMISSKHANFIVNMGGATAKDILQLLRLAQDTVRSQLGITMESEIRCVGRQPPP